MAVSQVPVGCIFPKYVVDHKIGELHFGYLHRRNSPMQICFRICGRPQIRIEWNRHPDPRCESTNSSGETQVSLTCIPVNYYREYVTIVAECVTISAVCVTIIAGCVTTLAECVTITAENVTIAAE